MKENEEIIVEYAPRWKQNKSIIFFIGLILIEFLCFRAYLFREFSHGYPQNFDQVGLLAVSYKYLELFLTRDWNALISIMFDNPQGFLFPIQAALFFLFSGPSWMNSIMLNFIYFVLTQLFIFYLVYGLSHSYKSSYGVLAVFLSFNTPFFFAGGMVDFRIDFFAYCLYTAAIGAIVRSEIFLDRKWTIIAASIASYMILMRFLTATYFFGIIIIFAAVYFLFFYKIDIARVRLKNLLVYYLGIISTLSLPILFLHRKAIYNYYVIGHLLGNEKVIRAKEAGIDDIVGHLLYYPKSMIAYHLGLLGTILVISVILYGGYQLTKIQPASLKNISPSIFFLVISVFVPMLILTANMSKSPVVASILLPPLLWLTATVVIQLHEIVPQNLFNKKIIVIVLVIFGAGNYVAHFSVHSSFVKNQIDARPLYQMYEDIGDYSTRYRIEKPSISVDQIVDYLSCYMLTNIYYENHGVFLDAQGALGHSIFELPVEEYWKKVKNSDVVIVNSSGYSSAATSPYPFNRSMESNRKELIDEAKKNRLLLNSYRYNGEDFQVYVTPVARLKGNTGDGWLLQEGTILELPDELLSSAIITISGPRTIINNITLDPIIKTARMQNGQELTSTVLVEGNQYVINIFYPGKHAKGDNKVFITFSNYFVPHDMGINNDERRLVVRDAVRVSVNFE